MSPSPSDSTNVPRAEIKESSTVILTYTKVGVNDQTNALITGYEVIRFEVPLIGEYMNKHVIGSIQVTIKPAVPGVQYRTTAWALHAVNNGDRVALPAVISSTTRDARKSDVYISLLYY